jgi:hypothetical protein
MTTNNRNVHHQKDEVINLFLFMPPLYHKVVEGIIL